MPPCGSGCPISADCPPHKIASIEVVSGGSVARVLLLGFEQQLTKRRPP